MSMAYRKNRTFIVIGACLSLLCLGAMGKADAIRVNQPAAPLYASSGPAHNDDIIFGGGGQLGAAVLDSSSDFFSGGCHFILFPTPCQFENTMAIYAGRANAAVAVKGGATWSITNKKGAVISSAIDESYAQITNDETFSSSAIHVMPGNGHFLLHNHGKITALQTNGIGIRVGSRYVPIYGWFGGAFHSFSWTNTGTIEGRVAIQVNSEGSLYLINDGVIYGDIELMDDIDSDVVELRGNAVLAGDVANIEKLLINRSPGDRSEDVFENEVQWRGRVTFSASGEEEKLVRIEEGATLAILGAEVEGGDVLAAPGADIRFSLRELEIMEGKALLSAPHNKISMPDATIFLDIRDVDIGGGREFLLMEAANLQVPSLDVRVLGAQTYTVKKINAGNRLSVELEPGSL